MSNVTTLVCTFVLAAVFAKTAPAAITADWLPGGRVSGGMIAQVRGDDFSGQTSRYGLTIFDAAGQVASTTAAIPPNAAANFTLTYTATGITFLITSGPSQSVTISAPLQGHAPLWQIALSTNAKKGGVVLENIRVQAPGLDRMFTGMQVLASASGQPTSYAVVRLSGVAESIVVTGTLRYTQSHSQNYFSVGLLASPEPETLFTAGFSLIVFALIAKKSPILRPKRRRDDTHSADPRP